ncbi:uncharacterized protein DUF1349 [Prauserella shujinwangii]|uniref:Uncharacterized protein DUF1349 n=1 Tax=Prauserella shujinwangii TaxID=1453103 RepID=A0A2T0LU62_9PSEU|nr:ThuA domain-containing protein [Prauserella shujinwangii]PRX47279.1 uncharacterized protein DUF1349 [Prauserella shujinwangii]
MSRRKRFLPRVGAVLIGALTAIGLVPAAAQAHPGHEQDPEFAALLFTKTAGYRHDSIPAGVAMFEQLAADHHFTLDHTEDSGVFDDATLAQYDVVIMFQTSGMVWENDAQRQAIQTYVDNGGGIAAIHNATDMGIENEFPWWDELVNAGAHMPSHSPGVLPGTAQVTDHQHPSTAGLPARWERSEEWYNFDRSMRGDVHVLVNADESTYNPGPDAMGADHPISWCRDVGQARVWATAMGHPTAAYSEELFVQHVLGGVRTAAGAVEADCSATVDDAFEKVALDSNTQAPTALTVAPDGRVFYTEILGQVKVFDPETQAVSTALDMPVYSGGEDGIVGITVDPGFADNGWLYLYYSPPGTEQVNRVSRFTVEGDAIARDSEVVLLEIPASRLEEPGHTGGYLTFGPGGNLYIGVGDDTNPFSSGGYAPIDERPGRSLFDAQGTSANTNDLRGKILRIHPEADGSYTIPEGNMFAPGTELTRPEIYAMGFRNPFRFTVDTDGTIYVADYGPDARSANPDRGPDGKVEWNVIRAPGFYGWPYCVANNIPYNDYDFATQTSGEKFDCANLVNDSPNNTGRAELPPAQQAEVWYGYGESAEFPIMGTGGAAPMAGPVYRYDADLESETKFPAYYDGKPFFYEWARNRIFSFHLDEQGSVHTIDPWLDSVDTLAPMDMRFGPDGSMYLLEWGGGYGRDNPDSGLYRIDYTQGNRRPVAQASATPSSGVAPLEVTFSSEGSHDPEGTELSYAWTFGDGGTSAEAAPVHTFTANGTYNVQLQVTDTTGKTGTTNLTVTVGNTAPTVELTAPPDGGFFDFGDEIAFDVDVTDPEDGAVDCSRVVLQPALGHDAHAHPLDPVNACEGTFETIVDEGHADANIFYSVDASYTDGGAEGLPPLVGRDIAVLQPKHKQAEYFTRSSGIRVVSQGGAEAGGRIGDIDDGDWIAFSPVNLTGIDQVALRVSSAGGGGSLELRAGAPDGALVATVDVPDTGGWNDYVTLPPVDVTDPGGTTELFAVFRSAVPGPYDLDSLTFLGTGVAVNAAPYVAVEASPTTGNAPLPVDFSATAIDPEGDEPLTFAWEFGDGATATGAEASHTYTAAGEYEAAVTVTDSTGRHKRVTVPIVVTPKVSPPIECRTEGSDEFTGEALDTGRWTMVRPEGSEYAVSDGHLVLPTAAGDINGSASGPISFVGQQAPSGTWSATTLVTIDATQQWQQGGILLWADDDNYARVNVQSNGSARELEFVRESGGQRTIRKGALATDGTSFHLRMESDGTSLTAYTSADGVTWTAYGDAFPVAGVADGRIGPYALKGDTPAPVIDASFDYFRISAAQGGPVDPDDEFDGDRLDGCRWNAVVRPDLATLRVEEGELRIDTVNADINGGDNGPAPNFVLQDAPEGDWTVETRLRAPLVERYQLAGFMVHGNDDDYVKFDVVAVNEPGSAPSLRAELVSENDGQFGNGGNRSIALGDTESGWWYLRLTRTGDSYEGWVSADGEQWTSVGQPVTNAVPDPAVGLMAVGPQQTEGPVTVAFDWFRLTAATADEEPPVTSAEVTPAEPDGAGGWYRTTPVVTLSADDGAGSGVAATEYRLDGGAWQPYTAPFEVGGDGAHVVEFRSTDAAGNAEQAGSRTLRLDGTAPALIVTGVEPDAEYGDSGAVTPGWTVADATSGAGEATATLDGQPVEGGTEVPLHTLDLGTHELVVTAADAAGNTVERTVAFTVTTSVADLRALVERFTDEGRISRPGAVALRASLFAAERAHTAGADRGAIAAMRVFASAAERTVTDQEVKAVLVRDAEALIQRWRG